MRKNSSPVIILHDQSKEGRFGQWTSQSSWEWTWNTHHIWNTSFYDSGQNIHGTVPHSSAMTRTRFVWGTITHSAPTARLSREGILNEHRLKRRHRNFQVRGLHVFKLVHWKICPEPCNSSQSSHRPCQMGTSDSVLTTGLSHKPRLPLGMWHLSWCLPNLQQIFLRGLGYVRERVTLLEKKAWGAQSSFSLCVGMKKEVQVFP